MITGKEIYNISMIEFVKSGLENIAWEDAPYMHDFYNALACGLNDQRARPTIVCLCGSTRFTDAYHAANLHETLAGNIVLSVGCDFKSDTDLLLAGVLTPADKERLDELHLRKIDLCDEVLVINVDGYIGQSTKREIAYAQANGKVIRWLEEV